MRPIKEQLEERLPWLFSELGFRIVVYSFNPARYDNSVAILESDGFRLRFVRDMGLVDAQVAPISDPEQWWNLKFVYEAIFGETPEPTLEGYGPLLRRRMGELAEALGPKLEQTRAAMERDSDARQKINWEFSSRGVPPHMALLSRMRRTSIGRILSNLIRGH
jgi:hypothetical protein